MLDDPERQVLNRAGSKRPFVQIAHRMSALLDDPESPLPVPVKRKQTFKRGREQ